jgi:hypothetical protein
MPCYDGRPAQTETEARIGNAVSLLKKLLEFLGRPVPEMVAEQYRNGYPNNRTIEPMLCELVGGLTAEEQTKLSICGEYWVPDLNGWWIQHKIQDAVFAGKESEFPKEQEAMFDVAIKKLTRVEAALLGVVDKWDLANNYTHSDEE